MQRTRSTKGRIVVGVVLTLSVVIAVLFTDDWGALVAHLLAGLVGVFVGTFLSIGAVRLFGRGASAARAIVVVWRVVGGLAITALALVVLLGDAMDAPQPNPASLAYWAVSGVAIGAVARAISMRRQLGSEDRP